MLEVHARFTSLVLVVSLRKPLELIARLWESINIVNRFVQEAAGSFLCPPPLCSPAHTLSS